MQLAKLRLKLRNDIRAKQLDEYKDAIRQRLLKDRDYENRVEDEEKMEYEAVEFHEVSGMSEQQAWRMNEVITDFECNYSEMVSDCAGERMKDESEESSESTSSSFYVENLVSLSKEYFDYSLHDLENIASFCYQSEAES